MSLRPTFCLTSSRTIRFTIFSTRRRDFCDAPWDPSQPVYLERSVTQLPLDAPILDSGIMSGDTLRFELYGVDQIDRESLSEAVSCDVTAGPEAGRSFVLLPGRHEVGRGAGNEVVLDDATVSDHHLSIIVYDDLTTALLPDTSATNPVVVNGRTITDVTTVGASDVVQFGATAVALRIFSRSSDAERDQLGQVPFRRTPYKPIIVSERVFKPIGNLPKKPEPRRFSPLPALLPVMLGLGAVRPDRQPYTLMMMIMSPVMMIGTFVESRKTGRQKFADQVDNLGERLSKRKSEVEQALLDERAERISQSPDLADLARRATLRTLDLWAAAARRRRVPAHPPRHRHGALQGQGRAGDGRRGPSPRGRSTSPSPDTIGWRPARSASTSPSWASSASTDRYPRSRRCARRCSSRRPRCTAPRISSSSCSKGHAQGLGTWVKWLPHTRSVNSPLAGPPRRRRRVGCRRHDARAGLRRPHCAPARTTAPITAGRGSSSSSTSRADVDPALASQLLELCPRAGISVVAAVESDARVPRQAKATFRCVPLVGGTLSTVWFTEPQAPSEEFEPEPANARLIDQVAMSLAPLRDATSASAATAIPRVVPLLSLFGPELPTPMSVAATWAIPKPYGLRAPIGIGPSGPLDLDLVEHGPHALIGGTSGAGKSELLQSIVASLIHEYPPTRLTFLFVDYKGGAASVVFNTVPHTVGYVTNLDSSLSLRALTSLRAELNHRMRLMEGKAKDLAEMLERFPDEAPPSLVIVVDEFATLVKEVPDFVAGVVDIAQRGRSLGVHLILATQRPSGSVNENILANTNLRISLRMLDASESKTVIGVGSAADIPLPLKGRAFAKLGPRDLIEFQSAFTGAPLTQDARSARSSCTASATSRAAVARPRPGGERRERRGRSLRERRSRRSAASGHRSRSVACSARPPARRSARPRSASRTRASRISRRSTSRGCWRRRSGLPMPATDAALPTESPPDRRRQRRRRRSSVHQEARRQSPTSTCCSTRCARRCPTCRRRASRGARCCPSSSHWSDDRTSRLHLGGRPPRPLHHHRHARRPGCPGPVPGGVRPRRGRRPAHRRQRRVRQDHGAAHRRAVGRDRGDARRGRPVRHRLRLAVVGAAARSAARRGGRDR